MRSRVVLAMVLAVGAVAGSVRADEAEGQTPAPVASAPAEPEPRLIAEHELEGRPIALVASADGSTVVYARYLRGFPARLAPGAKHDVVVAMDSETLELREVKRLSGTRQLAVSPDGTLIGAGDVVYEVSTGRYHCRVPGSIRAIGSEYGVVEVASGLAVVEMVGCVEENRRSHHWNDFGTFVLDPGGRWAASFPRLHNTKEPIQIWSLPGLARRKRLKGHRSGISTLALSPDGETLLAVGGLGLSWTLGMGRHVGGSITMWKTQGWKMVLHRETEEPFRDAAFSPDSRYVALSVGRGVELWRADLSEKVGDYPGVQVEFLGDKLVTVECGERGGGESCLLRLFATE